MQTERQCDQMEMVLLDSVSFELQTILFSVFFSGKKDISLSSQRPKINL